MIVLESDDLETGVVVSAARALGNDKYYASVDSIVQVYEHNRTKRLVGALPTQQSLSLKSGSLQLPSGHLPPDPNQGQIMVNVRTWSIRLEGKLISWR